jgi:hypothetical protein
MPYVPILAMYAAIGIQASSEFLAQKLSFKSNLPVIQACISVLLMLVLVYPSLANSVAIDQVFSNRDTRSLARDWLVAHLKPGEGLGIGMVFTHVDLPPIYKRYFLRPHSDGYDYENNHNHYIYRPNAELMSVSTNRNEFNVSTYSDEKFLRANGIKYVVLGTVTLPMYHMPEFEIEAVHNNPNLRKVISFNAFPEGQDPLPWQEYDSIDGFFVPFTKPGAIERPGPQIEIFEVLPEKSAG